MKQLDDIERGILDKRYEKKEQPEGAGVTPTVPEFRIGDTVDVHVRIQEGERERVQVFTGTVISRRGTGKKPTDSFTVRRIVQGEGVERVFPLHSPNVIKVEVKREGVVRRAKLYYLRERVGKGTRIKGKEQIRAGKQAKAAKSKAKAESGEAKKSEAAKGNSGDGSAE